MGRAAAPLSAARLCPHRPASAAAARARRAGLQRWSSRAARLADSLYMVRTHPHNPHSPTHNKHLPPHAPLHPCTTRRPLARAAGRSAGSTGPVSGHADVARCWQARPVFGTLEAAAANITTCKGTPMLPLGSRWPLQGTEQALRAAGTAAWPCWPAKLGINKAPHRSLGAPGAARHMHCAPALVLMTAQHRRGAARYTPVEGGRPSCVRGRARSIREPPGVPSRWLWPDDPAKSRPARRGLRAEACAQSARLARALRRARALAGAQCGATSRQSEVGRIGGPRQDAAAFATSAGARGSGRAGARPARAALRARPGVVFRFSNRGAAWHPIGERKGTACTGEA